MLWYLLKTWAGKEEELAKEIRRTVPPYMYEEVFVIRTERVWRRQGRSIVHPEPMFAGCVFLTCRETEPLFRRIERIPVLSKWMALGYLTMFPLREEDARFLETISGEDHLVRLSYVLREGKFSERETENSMETANAAAAYHVSGPLKYCIGDIDSFEFRKRFVKLRKCLWGEQIVIPMGIILNEDLQQKMIYGGSEVFILPPESPEKGSVLLRITKGADGKRIYTEDVSGRIHGEQHSGNCAGRGSQRLQPAAQFR